MFTLTESFQLLFKLKRFLLKALLVFTQKMFSTCINQIPSWNTKMNRKVFPARGSFPPISHKMHVPDSESLMAAVKYLQWRR